MDLKSEDVNFFRKNTFINESGEKHIFHFKGMSAVLLDIIENRRDDCVYEEIKNCDRLNNK